MHDAFVSDDYARRLRQARQDFTDMDAKEAAKRLGIPYPTYVGHENGSRGGRKNAEQYAKFYKVRLRWLLTGQGTPRSDPIAEIFDELPPDAQNYALSFLRHLRDQSKKPQ